MTGKFDYYDLLSMALPGTLLLAWATFCFPELSKEFSEMTFPAAFGVIVLTLLAVFIGHLIQSLASLVEPVLYWTFGGRPSDRALSGEVLGFFPTDSLDRIKAKLAKAVGSDAADASLFLFAMQLAETFPASRAPRFNALYGYHRGLLIMILVGSGLFGASMFLGRGASWSSWRSLLMIVFLLCIGLLVWYRCKQRAYYYVREVLLTAERIVDERTTTSKEKRNAEYRI